MTGRPAGSLSRPLRARHLRAGQRPRSHRPKAPLSSFSWHLTPPLAILTAPGQSAALVVCLQPCPRSRIFQHSTQAQARRLRAQTRPARPPARRRAWQPPPILMRPARRLERGRPAVRGMAHRVVAAADSATLKAGLVFANSCAGPVPSRDREAASRTRSTRRIIRWT